MNEEQVGRIVSLVRTLYPHQRMDENPQNVVDAWSVVILDLDFDETRAAVVQQGRSGASWCSPGDIRKRVARLRNVLAPHVDDLMRDLQDVASHGGSGRTLLHPLAQRIYATAGGSPAISNMTPGQLQQLRRQVEADVAAHDERELTAATMRPTVAGYEPVKVRLDQQRRQLQIGEQ